MGDREHAKIVVVGHRLDAPGDVAERVDVEAGVDLVEDGELRAEHGELQRLGPLLLAAGELDVHPTREELVADRQSRGFAGDALDRGRVAVGGRGHQLQHAHAGNLDRVLVGEEQAEAGAFPRRAPEELLAVDRRGALGDRVVVAAHEHVGERRLAGAVGAHEGVHLTGRDLEVDAAQDLHSRDRRMQVRDPQDAHRSTITSSPSTRVPYTGTGWVAGRVCGSPLSSEKVEPCLGHSISRSSAQTSPSERE